MELKFELSSLQGDAEKQQVQPTSKQVSPSLPGTLLNPSLQSGTRRGAESPGEPRCSETPVPNSRAPGLHGNSGFCPASSENHFAGSKK